MATDVQIGVEYDTPSQPPDNGDGLGLGGPVTRQVGLAPAQQVGFDPVPPQPVIQGDPNTVVVRNSGPHVRGYFDRSGIFRADSEADDGNVVYADSGVQAGVSNQPPGLARIAEALTPTANPTPERITAFGDMAAAQQRDAAKKAAEALGFVVTEPAAAPVVDVVASDSGSNDPRDLGGAPKVFSASDLPVIKKSPVVPIDLPTPKTRRIVAKAAPKGKR